jgi:hypothetical protein
MQGIAPTLKAFDPLCATMLRQAQAQDAILELNMTVEQST